MRELYHLACEEISGSWRRASRLLEDAEADAPAYPDFTYAHHRRLRTNNVRERANRELKRRSRVVQVFPSRRSLIRMPGPSSRRWTRTGGRGSGSPRSRWSRRRPRPRPRRPPGHTRAPPRSTRGASSTSRSPTTRSEGGRLDVGLEYGCDSRRLHQLSGHYLFSLFDWGTILKI